MVQELITKVTPEIIYPESDGIPMADNTKQFRWIVILKENLEILFAQQEDVFVAGNIFWYPVRNNNTIRQAPDVMVVFGRPKGDRGSYRQWEENNIPPQVVFEILSPGNRPQEMLKKLFWYQRYGVQEYYIYDPETVELTVSRRVEDHLEEIDSSSGWVSPLLGIRFEITEDTLEIYRPDGDKFLTSVELAQLRQQERLEKEQAILEKEQALAELEQEKQRYQVLLEKLRAKNIDPENL